jgi:hypothetical protein
MQPYDVEEVLAELHRVKKENLALIEERTLLRVAADKYEKRAIYTRRKYQELLSKPNDTPSTNNEKLRLKVTTLKQQLKAKEQELINKEETL